MKVAPFTRHTKYSDKKGLAHRRTLARLWANFKEFFDMDLESYTRQDAMASLFE